MPNVEHQIAKSITDKRLLARKKQEEVAAALNVSTGTIWNWEHSIHSPDIASMWELADLYDCSIDELVGRNTS